MNSSKLDLSGLRFGRLVAVSQFSTYTQQCGAKVEIWHCVCDCGKEKNVRKPELTKGETRSCGCLRREATSNLKRKHGLAHKTASYDIWVLMRQRCNNPKATGYAYYGGKGVKVCERWDSFELFLSDMGERPGELTLDRIDPYGDYSPENCRWADWFVQNKNKRHQRESHAIAQPTNHGAATKAVFL